MKKLFGTDGIRAAAGEFPLDAGSIFTIGRSLARQFREKPGRGPRFVTGRDTRESGPWIEAAFHAGAHAESAVCESAGIITTPGVAFITRNFDFDAGIVISASHNPFEDNGIKIFSPTGKKLDEATERVIEKDIFESAGKATEPSKPDEADVSRAPEFRESYLDYLTSQFDDLDLKNFRMVVDCANGAASDLAPELFTRLGAAVTAIYDRPDGRNINKDCGSLHLDKLQARVIEEKADFGVAFDGDADRALFVDEKGNLVDGDATLWILARYLKSHGQLNGNTVIATVMSNIGLEKALQSRDISLSRTAVGDKYVLEELINSGSSIGGEQSGHIIMPAKSLVGDGMMTTLFLLEAMHEKGRRISEMTAGFTRYPQVLVNIRVNNKLPFDTVPSIAEAAARLEEELDGSGRLLLRYSGTENLARVMIEGQDQARIETQAHALAEVIRSSLA